MTKTIFTEAQKEKNLARLDSRLTSAIIFEDKKLIYSIRRVARLHNKAGVVDRANKALEDF